MFGLGSPIHWVLLLVIILLIFGTGKLRNVGGDIAAAIRNFKKGMKESDEGDEDDKAKAAQQLRAAPPAETSAKVKSEQRDRAP